MKLKFLITVPDKYTGAEYKADEVYEFDNKRAKEILQARTSVTNEPYAVEYVENTVEKVFDEVIEDITGLEMKPVVLEDMKVAELKDLAKEMEIADYNKMKKTELIEAIKNNG